MTREEAIDGLKAVRTIHNGNYAPQIDKAIASLEAWDKVKKEILSKSIIKTHSDGLKSACDIYLSGFSDGLESAFDIIEKHLKEIEE